MTRPDCNHDGLYWYAAPANEQGWRCADCGWQPGEPPGYSPQHDRSHLRTKVWCLVHDLHDAGLIYVSNSEYGEGLTDHATEICEERRLYDSVSIARVVLEIKSDESHAKYWRELGDGILAGKDPRPRCACGQLATMSSCVGGAVTRACSPGCMSTALGRPPDDPW